MNNKSNNSLNNNNNNNINRIQNNNDNISEPSSPTRSRQEREFEQHRQRQHILLMKSNKMFKRCCCYMLILCVSVLLPAHVAAIASEIISITTDAPPPKRLTTAAEILQLPHAFRHEEHYSHRIEQAVNDFKRAQLQQLKERDKNLTTKAPSSSASAIDNGYGNNKNENNNDNDNDNFPQSWQLEPHHRRHEQHYLQQNEQRQHLPHTEHRLRHSNSQHGTWEERVLPPMRHQRHQLKQRNPPVTNALTTGLVEGKSSGSQRLTLQLNTNTFGDNFDDSSAYSDEEDDDSGDDSDTDDHHGADDDDDDDDNDEEDDSFESQSRESTYKNLFPRSSNSYSNIDGKAASVKRYTNPFKNYKASAGGTKKRWNFFDDQKVQRNNDEIEKGRNHANVGVDDSTDTSGDDDSMDFTKEKWRKIREEHYRRQQEHQRERQALRLRHNPVATNQVSPHQSKNEETIDTVYSSNYIPGTLTLQKIEKLDTLGVHSSFKKLKKYKDLANAHIRQVRNESTCRIPQRRVERIQLHPSKIYTPHCTILHRCADDTGCCRSERQTCAPKHTKSVDLYFFVQDIDNKTPTVERLTFINHTECHCVERSQHKPLEYHENNLVAGNNGHDFILRRATILNCNCPKFFEKILQEDDFCRCDCSSSNTDCNWLKRGMEHFSVIDRKCMLEGRCKPPTCEYGTYLKKHGRCPRREEQLAYALSGSTNNLAETQSFH